MANYINRKFKSLGFMVAAATAVFMTAIFVPQRAMAHDPDPGETTYPFEEMTILTEYDIQLRGTAIVRNGNLCSRRGNVNIGPGKVKIPRDGSPTSDVIAATGTITVTGRAKVAHCRGTVVGGTCGTVDDAIPCPDDPPFPNFTASADPVDDIYCVKTGGGTTIVPGTYRDLIVNTPGATCKFDGPGDYNFRRIVGKKKGIYIFMNAPDPCDLNRPFNINVKEFMYVGEFSKFNKASVVPSFIHVEGADGYYDSNNTSPDGLDGLGPSAFFYQGDGAFCACKVFAPNGTISIRGHLKTSCSQWVGKHFQQIDKLRINLGLPFEPECCIQVPPRQCPCILDFYEEGQPPVDKNDKKVDAGGRICIEGKQLSEYNVDKVLFFEESNTSITDFLDCAQNADCEVLQANITFAADQKSMCLEVPYTCSNANYRLLIEDNDNFCGRKTDLLDVD